MKTKKKRESSKDNEPVARRIVRYEFGVQRCAYIGAGYGGVLLLTGFAGDRVWSNAWRWVVPVLMVAITFGVAVLAWAYLKYSSALRDLRLTTPQQNAGPYSRTPHTMYLIAVTILGLVAAAVLTATGIVLFADPTVVPHPSSGIAALPAGREAVTYLMQQSDTPSHASGYAIGNVAVTTMSG